MKVLVFGATGMLGHKLVQVLKKKFDTWSAVRTDFASIERFGISEKEKTVTGVFAEDLNSVEKALERIQPSVVINAAGIVKQKQTSKNVVGMLEVNSIFPHRLAELGATNGFRLITVSTDCVFAGTRGNYSEDDQPDALDLYGQSKHFGEILSENCLTIRTSIIGRELATRQGLLEWLIGQHRKKVNGYAKAIFSGFPTVVFADIILDIIVNYPNLCGVFHISSEPISKFDLLEKIRNRLDLEVEIEKFDDFVIDRSLDSTRFRTETGFSPMTWDEMIDRIAADTTPYYKWNR